MTRRRIVHAYPARDGWRWHLIASNGRILADSGQAYSTEYDCRDIARDIFDSRYPVIADHPTRTLATLDRAGIRDDDARTLIRSAIVAVLDDSDAAAVAIDDLGLTVAAGPLDVEFVGLDDVMQQLIDAAKRIPHDRYMAATDTLFGSDAMRLAGIAYRLGQEA